MLKPDENIIDFIDSLETGKYPFKLITALPDSEIDSKFLKNENNNFQLSFTIDSKINNLDLDYFFKKPFLVITNGLTLLIENYEVEQGSQSIDEDSPINFEIEINAFKNVTKNSDIKSSKHKAFIKFDNKIFDPSKSGILFDLTTKTNNNGESNSLLLKIDGFELIFYYEIITSDYGYFVFNSNQKTEFKKFEHIINTIITTYGFLTGYYMLDTIYYFSYNKISEENILSFSYKNYQRLINTNKPILEGRTYKDVPKEKLQLSSKQFNNLANLIYSDDDYLRSAYLLIESGKLNGSSKAAISSVALETITKKIDLKSINTKIIDDKKTIKSLRYKLNKVLKEFSDFLSEEQSTILSDKLNNINNKPNSSKLFGAFSYLNISLNKEEKDCINSRNLFLHGNIPRKKENMRISEQELLNIMANRLTMLSSILLLKQAGYNGMVIDHGATEVIKWRMIKKGEIASGGNYLRDIETNNDNS